jgi:cytochrome c oxidase cbb3-type subunit 4
MSMPFEILSEMSSGMIRGLGTVVVFVAFVGLTLWVFNSKRNPEFAEARLLPFADEPQPENSTQQESTTRSIRP